MRGPKPKPTELARKSGAKRTRATVTVAGRGRPSMPRGLSKDAQAAWKQLVADMEAGGILDRSDWPLIEVAAVTIGHMREARRMVAKHGAVSVSSRGTPTKSPWYRIERECMAEIRQLLDQLGVGPVGRARLGMKGVKGRSLDDEMNSVVGGRGLHIVK